MKTGQLFFGVPILFGPPPRFCNRVASMCKTEKPPHWWGWGATPPIEWWGIPPNARGGDNPPSRVVNKRTLDATTE